MTFFRRHGRAWTWIALLAILGLSLAPALSHALATSAAQDPWNQVCTAHGPEQADAATAAPATQPAHGDPLAHLEHCPFCALGGIAPLLPTASPIDVPAANAIEGRPATTDPLPARPEAWRAAPARAPPMGFTHR